MFKLSEEEQKEVAHLLNNSPTIDTTLDADNHLLVSEYLKIIKIIYTLGIRFSNRREVMMRGMRRSAYIAK